MKIIDSPAYTFDDCCLVPNYTNITSRSVPQLHTNLTRSRKIKIPIINSPMDSVVSLGLSKILYKMGTVPILHRFYPTHEELIETIDSLDNDNVSYFISVGAMTEEEFEGRREFFSYLVGKDGFIGINIDLANGHSSFCLKTIELIKKFASEIDIIAGNVCTRAGALDLVNAGADAIRVGIGNGSACTTRLVTGHGIPLLTSIMECYDVAKSYAPIICDGGIRDSGDIVKALAAGASCVMLGKMLALTEESAADKEVKYLLSEPGVTYAKFRGQASKDFQNDVFGGVKLNTVPEGVDFWAPVQGKAEQVINDLLGGIRSGLTYSGAKTIQELQQKAVFRPVMSGYKMESNPRT